MSAMDKLVETMLKVSGLNVEEVKTTITQRVVNFEKGVKSVETSLLMIHQGQRNMEHNIKRLLALQDMEWQEAPQPLTINGEARDAR